MIKMRGVLAVPGEYRYGDTVEVKTAEELRDAAERYPIVPLTFGHTLDGMPPPKAQQIGTVSQKWNEQEQRVNAEFWFHEEKIPDTLRLKIDAGEALPISAGVLLDSVEEGVQHGIAYTHIAILEGEDPTCPLDKCGAFIRLESTSSRLVRIEQATELKQAEKKEPEAAPVKTETVTTVNAETKPEPKPESPVEQKPKEPDAVPTSTPEEVKLVPEVIIPAELTTVKKEFEVIDGMYVWVPPIYRTQTTQQEKKD